MKLVPDRVFDREPHVVVGLYLGLGAVCVPVLDVLGGAIGVTDGGWTLAWLLGGWLLVGLSSLFLYGTVVHHSRRVTSARSELETSNQQLQVLSRVFRHNVRNDLNVVQGYADLLERRLEDERSRECLETIRETTENIVEISEKLRAIEDASGKPGDDRVDLAAIVIEVIADLDAEGVDIDVDVPDTAWIRADGSVRYPVREVFENAIAHNDKSDRRIVARIDGDGETTRLAVHDNGPGIPADERAVLQAEEETPLSHASSIGLWLVKWMCELQGGTVQFEAGDAGTTVSLRFQSADGPRTEA